MYDSVFDETCVTIFDNTDLTKKVFELQEEVESFRLVKSELSNKIMLLEVESDVLNERGLIYGNNDVRDT